MAPLVAVRRVPVVLMHNRSTPEAVQLDPDFGAHYAGVEYTDLVPDVASELMASVSHGRSAGVDDGQVILE